MFICPTNVYYYFHIAKLLLTPLKKMVVPPPMSTYTVQLDGAINMLSYGVNEKQHDIITYLSNNKFCILYYLPNGTYESKIINNIDESLSHRSLRHLIWLKSDLLVGVVDDENGNTILFIKIELCGNDISLVVR